jgi:hypothetical protein
MEVAAQPQQFNSSPVRFSVRYTAAKPDSRAADAQYQSLVRFARRAGDPLAQARGAIPDDCTNTVGRPGARPRRRRVAQCPTALSRSVGRPRAGRAHMGRRDGIAVPLST